MSTGITPADFVRRLEEQHRALTLLLGDARPDQLDRPPSPGVWSAREHLAHLGRYQDVFRARLARMLAEDTPELGRYRAADDPEFAEWAALPYAELMARTAGGRAELAAAVTKLTPADLGRAGRHPLLGTITVADWLEFYLVHEAHHHYVALTRARAAAPSA